MDQPCLPVFRHSNLFWNRDNQISLIDSHKPIYQVTFFTARQNNTGKQENAQHIANHELRRTTKRYAGAREQSQSSS
jgi:hypothetical protein